MNFEILTLFPEMLTGFFSQSIVDRAVKKGLISVNLTNIRDFTKDKHKKVDDAPYGGGYGMIMTCQPSVDAIRAVKDGLKGSVITVYLTPQGSLFNHAKAKELSAFDNIILFCGHYEGIDERIITLEIDEEISIGDYVLTGGELPAAVVTDCVSRLIDGVLPSPDCHEDESIASGLLEYPQYTKPRVFEGLEVPEILFSGHHANIESWRKEQSLLRTREKRPDLKV
ncbi:MAG: tRNA (guanosine(37)-N1)-methyltransferase TrmD [Eubacteriales bacterium]